jgi:PIN domain nuclease of toxin-antitoxin system
MWIQKVQGARACTLHSGRLADQGDFEAWVQSLSAENPKPAPSSPCADTARLASTGQLHLTTLDQEDCHVYRRQHARGQDLAVGTGPSGRVGRLLLDTHVALWAVTESPRLSARARSLILEADEVRVSCATVWKIAIKYALARGDMPVSAQQALQAFEDAGYGMPAIGPDHVLALETLPALHKDPFDRMLVAQALTEPLRLVTADSTMARYSDLVMLV